MDKYEYRVRADEIKELIAQEEYSQAAEIADTIDWRRVKSVMMLCTISDLYKINRRYEDARDMLLLAYERRPGGKTICYSLCELSIKTEEFVQAVEYYKEFVQVAPKDPGRYILQYKLYEAQDVSLEERIDVLEEFKKRDYREKWAYELAYLYHRIGLATKCVEECDELILWFGEGKYVTKAMELKMLHQPLSPSQQERYDHRFDPSYTAEPQNSEEEPVEDLAGEPTEYENFQEYFEETQGEGMVMEYPEEPAPYEEQSYSETFLPEESEVSPNVEDGHTKIYGAVQPEDELDIYVKPMDMGKYNTLNLQAELAAGLKEVLDDDHKADRNSAITRAIVAPMLEETDTESLDYPQIEEVNEEDLEPETEIEEMEESEVFFGETGEIVNVATQTLKQYKEEPADLTAAKVMEELRQESLVQQNPEQTVGQIINVEPPKEIAHVLTQESDGQLTLLMPENTSVEKQITGQMNITDILAEWERMKKESEERRKEEVRQRVLEQTGDMFTEFEASVRDGLLEKLENDTISDDMTEEVLEELEEVVEELAETVTEDIVEDLVEASPEDVVEDLAEAMTEEMVEDYAEAETEDIVEDYAETETEDIVEDYAEAETEEMVEDYAEAETEEIVEDYAEAEAEDMVEESAEAAQEDMVEESAEAAPEDMVEESAEAMAEDEIEELVEDISESVEEEFVQESAADSEGELIEEILEEVIEETASASEKDGYQERIPESLAYQTGSADEPSDEEDSGRPPVRALTKEERELFAPFIQSRSAREQLVNVVDNISMAAYEGNVIITGEEGMDTLTLAKNIVREVKMTDSNFSGKVAKISGRSFLSKSVDETIAQLPGGALIIQHASAMPDDVAEELYKALQQENQGIVVILEDTKKAMDKFLAQNAQLATCFTARMDVEALSNDTLVAFGRQYAREMEYSIDEFGILALHTRIEERQTIDHAVTVIEVKKLVDDAIRHANRKTLGHFFDVLFAKRYDEEDMIILGEKDFI
ncbi:MAG: hypothetical protein NC417_04550 [Candidatus Gastranaerophilales bacterium]|nr:hypothetical protein [Candidatus Gastranaerophilales bacterium]